MFRFPDGMHYGKEPRWGVGTAGRGSVFWAVTGIFVLAVLLGGDLIWIFVEDGVTFVLEFIAERLERFFQKSLDLDLYHAQMATAYAGSFILLTSGLLLLRKLVGFARHAYEDGTVWWGQNSARWAVNVRLWGERALRWWATLDLINKSAVVVALVVMVIPMALLLSFGLGMAVAEIL